mgnify:CR=1 FL=1
MIGCILIANWIIGIILIELALKKHKSLINVDESRDSKYSSFRRTDVHLWSRPRLYIGSFFVIPKLTFIVSSALIYGLYAKIVLFFNSDEQPKSKLQRFLLQYVHRLLVRIWLLLCSNIYWISVSKPKVDYTKYLGPGWKPTYTNPNTIVSNH